MTRPSRLRADHRLELNDRGAKLWGRCACGMWADLMTYEMPKGRLVKLRERYRAHVAAETITLTRQSKGGRTR